MTDLATDLVQLHHGDCLDVLRTLPDCSIDSVVTDPPYGLGNTDPGHVADTIVRWVNGDRDYLPSGSGFMGKAWDSFVPPVAVWDECLRVLKPGGHVVAFAGSRTMDLMTLGLRLGGFEIRDSLAWLYGSGFPKSMDVSKAIDKSAGAERPVLGVAADFARGGLGRKTDGSHVGPHEHQGGHGFADRWSAPVTGPGSAEAEQWEGWGTALKPAFEPIVVGRKPLAGTVAANVLAHGTGALNIDACRIGSTSTTRMKRGGSNDFPHEDDSWVPRDVQVGSDDGRWPSNVVLDESQAEALDEQSGVLTSGADPTRRGSDKIRDAYGDFAGQEECTPARGADSGGASRFFYVAKADQSERVRINGVAHPTVKPLNLMRWLVRLVTPPGGTVLEPFAGSGTTVEACFLEGFRCIAIEREADYLPLIRQRLLRRQDPVAAVRGAGTDAGLFDLLDGGVA